MSDELGSEDDYKELRPDFELEEETDVSIDEMLSSDLDEPEDNLDDVDLLSGQLDDFDLEEDIEPVKPEKKKKEKKKSKSNSKPEAPKKTKYAYGSKMVITGSILSYLFGLLFCYALIEIVSVTNEGPDFSVGEKLIMCIISGLFYQISVSAYLLRAKV